MTVQPLAIKRAVLVAFASWLMAGATCVFAVNLTGITPDSSNLVFEGTPSDLINDPDATIYDGLTVTDTIASLNGVEGGWTMNATFTPSANDVVAGTTRLIMEIGGTSNASALWLVDGIPTLSLKSGGGGDTPSSYVINDTNIEDGAAAIYSVLGPVVANDEYTIAASWDTANQFVLAVRNNNANTGYQQTAIVYGAEDYNWSGDGSLEFGTIFNGDGEGNPGKWGGLNNADYDAMMGEVPNPLHVDRAESMEGSFQGVGHTFFLNDSAFTGPGGSTSLSLSGAAAAEFLSLTVDLDNLTITVSNPTSSAVDVDAYTLAAGLGGFDQGSGPVGEVTADGEGSALFTVPAGGSLIIPGVSWVESPFTDAGALLTYGGNDVNVPVAYVGTPAPYGDLDGSGMVDAADWPLLYANLISDVSNLDGINRYLAGDLRPNGQVNRNDFREFKQLYDAANGIGAFQAMVSGTSVPEPSTTILLVSMVAGGLLMRCRKHAGFMLVAFVAAAGIGRSAVASDIYMVSNTGEIRSFTSVGGGAGSIDDVGTFAGGALETTIAAYGAYQGFTSLPNGSVYGVNSTGGVDSWPTLSDWLANTNVSNESTDVYGALVTSSPRSGIHGFSFDGGTGGLYAVLEGPDENEGDLVQFSTLKNFVNNSNGDIYTPRGYNGNITVFYYPDEDAPASSIAQNADAGPGSNYLHITGGGQLEGWEGQLTEAGFGMYGPPGTPGGTGGGGNRSYQLQSFGSEVIGAFAIVPDTEELSLLVDTTTGVVSLQRATSNRVIDRLRVQSSGGGLLADGFTGLGGSGVFPAGDGTGNGWERAPSNSGDTGNKHEFFAFGSSTIETSGGLIPLGMFYDTEQDLQDLVLWYDEVSGGVNDVQEFAVGGLYTDYVQTAGLAGDYNGDGEVNVADYTVWRDNLGGSSTSLENRSVALAGTAIGSIDYQVWKSNFGASLESAVTAVAVPEPSSTTLLLLTCVAFAACRATARANSSAS